MIHRITYYVYDVVTDLPAFIGDTATEAANFIGCCRSMVYKMAKNDISYNGYKVLLLLDDPAHYDED